jgi:hypothetical protein
VQDPEIDHERYYEPVIEQGLLDDFSTLGLHVHEGRSDEDLTEEVLGLAWRYGLLWKHTPPNLDSADFATVPQYMGFAQHVYAVVAAIALTEESNATPASDLEEAVRIIEEHHPCDWFCNHWNSEWRTRKSAIREWARTNVNALLKSERVVVQVSDGDAIDRFGKRKLGWVPGYRPDSLIGAVVVQLAGHMFRGSQLRRCIRPNCKRLFVAPSKSRAEYCQYGRELRIRSNCQELAKAERQQADKGNK